MRYLLVFPILYFLIACSSKMSNENSMDHELEVRIDTVYLDSKGENIFVFNGLSVSDLSEDRRLFYNFDFKSPSIEVLNLDNLEFEDRILLEKEGPDGVGEMVYDFNRLGTNHFYSGSRDRQYGIIDRNGRKLKNIDLKEFEALFDIPISLNNSLVFEESPLSIFGDLTLWNQDGTSGNRLAIWKVDEKVIDSYDINKWINISDFKSVITTPSWDMPAYAYWLNIEVWQDQVLASSNVTSSLVRYQNGVFELIEIDHQLIAKEKKGRLSNRYESREEFELAFKELQKEINFSKPVWDVDNAIFYRFAYKEKSVDEQSSRKAEVFLVVMDRDFKVLHEIAIPQLTKSPNFHFVKDGQIWMFENVEDEVSFVRISVDGVKKNQ